MDRIEQDPKAFTGVQAPGEQKSYVIYAKSSPARCYQRAHTDGAQSTGDSCVAGRAYLQHFSILKVALHSIAWHGVLSGIEKFLDFDPFTSALSGWLLEH
jgi:hypothetical protein